MRPPKPLIRPASRLISGRPLRREIEELQGKIERLGNVNIEAIKEQDELEIRETFLLGQREDLDKSQQALRNLIEKINHTSRELFEKVFNDIRANFQIMFRKLFGGGKADILLEENVDILEAGIEIIAQPPNKELRSITLLSGGEKVMTTVSLLFAVFQSKPSPFCILDEVDAALDESNIKRFGLIVKRIHQRHAIPHHHPQQGHHERSRRNVRHHHAGTRRIKEDRRKV